MVTTTKNELMQLKDMLQNNYALSLDNYFKCLITLAYELTIQDEVDMAQSYLEEIPAAYINKRLINQVQMDPLFKLSLLALRDVFTEKGLLFMNQNFNKFINNSNNLK